ncbi:MULTISPECIES: bifunctional oligoribonuclease/PAP phosphatase NrnA [unclassified Meiothermus]|uniref:DHH family phosphoesterase n=1 Tax=unclassified Meiothermus TaxID=370471 RepID=UPI000D7C58E6|nr:MULTISPECIES: bifunctional oligoribonuclease/PAP phosphatase NrnA [unclassified Meiothermus]PZA07606.1 bifunctional oligoribonuclease/PAP phosphatase NrnA [Meiothermus sp. Pnk-1]RYM36823.1 bifunctional oligoribonuclease/PAP phosphatase NrnA [Meiothermus sp. PNK-Is4]
MNPAINHAEPRYREKLDMAAEALKKFSGPIYVVTHVDPDGDAVGSSLGLALALEAMGKEVFWICQPPRYLQFLAEDYRNSPPISRVPEGALLVVLDAAEPSRVEGAPVEGYVINIDHHGTNPRFGDISVVDPSKAATAQIVKDLIDAMGVAWTPAIATPVLTGMITDTGNFAFANTTPELLRTAADLIAQGVAYAELTDRLKWRPPGYFQLMGKVLSTVEFHFGGLLVTAHLPPGLNGETGGEEDSDDFVGTIRYAEGSLVAVFLRERGPDTKLSIRSRGRVSAQNIAVKLGGGGHVPAAGATLRGMGLSDAYGRLLPVVEEELKRAGYL